MLIQTIMRLASVAGLAVDPGFLALLVPRVAHASLHQFGTAIELVRNAVMAAVSPTKPDGTPLPMGHALLLRHFADVFAATTGNAAFANPFVTDDWQALDCRRVLVTDPKQIAAQEAERFEPRSESKRRRIR